MARETTAAEQTFQEAVRRHAHGEPLAAEECCRRVLRIDARHSGALHLLGVVAREREDREQAVGLMRRAVAAAPESVESRLLLANWQADGGDFEAAIAEYRRILDADPRCTAAWFNLGRTLQDVERYRESTDCYLQALDLEPGFRDAALNLGIVLRYIGRLDEAAAVFTRLVDGNCDDAEAHLQRALTRVSAGDFVRGWEEYGWRWKAEATPRPFDRPLWDGSPLGEGTLLLFAEQGIGDEIQFASCVPDVATRVERCLLECEPRLVPLFRRSFPGVDVVSAPVSGCDFDVQLPIGDLPRLFRRSVDDFPGRRSWLRAEEAQVGRWKRRFADCGARMTIGVSWRGGKKPDVQRSRSTQLAQWSAVLQSSNATVVNLQYGDVAAELESLRTATGLRVRNWPDADPMKDLDDLAAQISAVDLVISVDNSTVHVAGALGRPVWTLLPFASDYRWMRGTDCSPWYPSMRLFRQPAAGDWDAVFREVAIALRSFKL
ncbi:MAG: tetratricopeptide repeat protein [Planctomycetaceae bacterium]